MLSVYGATGFIGSRFCEMFPNETVSISRDSRTPKTKEVLYFISTTHNFHIYTDPYLDIETNLSVLVETLEQCKKDKNIFNFISSWFVYGDCGLPAKEDVACRPKGFYSITKHCAEQLVTSYCKSFDIPYRILRLSNVYGNEATGISQKKNALQFIISKLRENETVNLYSNGSFTRDYIHIDDTCRAIKTVIDRAPHNQTINVGCGEPIGFKNVIDYSAKLLHSKSKILSLPMPRRYELVHINHMYLDVTRLKELGFKPQVTIKEGIRRLCQKE